MANHHHSNRKHQPEQDDALREAVRQLNERGECAGCGGTGYNSAPCADDVPASMRPIGVSPCFLCHGTGLAPESVVQPTDMGFKARTVTPKPVEQTDAHKCPNCGFLATLSPRERKAWWKEVGVYRDKAKALTKERDQYKEQLDTLVGLVETADKNTGSAVAAFNRITLRYKDWNKLRSYAEDAGGTK